MYLFLVPFLLNVVYNAIVFYIWCCCIFMNWNKDWNEMKKDEELSPNARVYLQWCCDMIFFLPLVIMLLHHNRIFRMTHCVLIEGYSSFMNFLDGGDIVFLTGLFGVFAVSVMRLIAAIGIILRQFHTGMDDKLVLACFAVVFSLFDLCRAWVMTYFLFLVQRQNLIAELKTKWIMISLVYTGVANATQWVLVSRDMNMWPVQSAFFAAGIGQSVGLLLNPVCMLYKLFVSVVAYDALQNILSQSPTQSGWNYHGPSIKSFVYSLMFGFP